MRRIVSENPKTNSIVREYILPDFASNKRGHVRAKDEPLADSSQILYMNNERFSVPELLFRPDDIGKVLGLHKLDNEVHFPL